MKLSVIIPTFNRRSVLERTLPALAAQDLPRDEYEVIVVVDGSTDGTMEMLRGWNERCGFVSLEAQHRGAGAARNVGLQAARGELVLFLDDDLIAGPDLLRRHWEAHDGADDCVVHGPIYIAEGSSPTIIRHVIEEFYDEYHCRLDPAMDMRYPDGLPESLGVLSSMVNSSVARTTLLDVGGFDERILAAEDLELGLRLWKRGMRFRYQSAAEVGEFYVKATRQYLRRQAWALGAGDLIAGRKHSEYRPHSRLSVLAETRAHKRWVRSALMGSPISPVPLLALPFCLERWLYPVKWLRRPAKRLLLFLETVTRLRSALHSAGSWKALESEFDRRVPALMYHHVGPARAGTYREWTVSLEQFERQIGWLARKGYAGITATQWLRWLREGTGLPEKPVLITFDDGYADTAEFALPILQRYGFGAVMFVVTERLGGTNTWDEAQGSGTLQLMTAEQVKHWAGQGIEFGSHSRTHPDLTKVTAEGLVSEIEGSKRDLAALGVEAVAFAYPFGEQNDAVRAVARQHFELAFGTDEGMNFLRTERDLQRRINVGPEQSGVEFGLNVRLGGTKALRDLRVRLGLRTRLRRLLGRAAG